MLSCKVFYEIRKHFQFMHVFLVTWKYRYGPTCHAHTLCHPFKFIIFSTKMRNVAKTKIWEFYVQSHLNAAEDYWHIITDKSGVHVSKMVWAKRYSLNFVTKTGPNNRLVPVADPGFSPGGGANSQKPIILSIFCQKLHENERIWTPRGARVPGAPLRSANGCTVQPLWGWWPHGKSRIR